MAVEFSTAFEDALTYASLRHAGQTRKGTGAPYLTHLVSVARLVASHGYDVAHEQVALLHDVLEDTCPDQAERDATEADLEVRFGAEIRDAIVALSEPKRTVDGERLPWRARKEAYIATLSSADPLALRVSAADKIHNLATLLASLEQRGPDVWRQFNGGPAESAWFYRAVLEVVTARLAGEAIPETLEPLVVRLERRAKHDQEALA